jgi:hypothetical protein
MAHFIITSILPVLITGALLGRRFSALVLVPAGLIVVIAIAVFGTALSASFWGCVVAAVVGLSCLQLGYFAAVAIGQFNRQSQGVSQSELERYGRNQ